MVTNDGHLIFQTGVNHNITFKTGGGNGRIVIDTFDLVEMAKTVRGRSRGGDDVTISHSRRVEGMAA